MLLQSNWFGETLIEAMPPSADEPSSTSAGVRLTSPLASRLREMFWHTAFGNWLFSTVTLAVQLLLLPFTSGTVSVTWLMPTLARVNVVGLTVRVPRAQLSKLPLLTWAAVTAALPLASS